MDPLLRYHFSEASVMSWLHAVALCMPHPVLSGIEAFLLVVALFRQSPAAIPQRSRCLPGSVSVLQPGPCLVAGAGLGGADPWLPGAVWKQAGGGFHWCCGGLNPGSKLNFKRPDSCRASLDSVVCWRGFQYDIENPVFSPFTWGVVAH